MLPRAVLCLALTLSGASAQSVLDTLGQELQRNFEILTQKADPAPYFLAYQVTEQEFHTMTASFGAISANNTMRRRIFDVTVRVGSPQMDNYRRIRGDLPRFTSGASLPIEDDPAALKRRIWFETDKAYRLAAERLIKLRTNTQVRVEAEDKSDDFAPADPVVAVNPTVKLEFSPDPWLARIRKLSAEFDRYPGVLAGSVTLSVQAETKRLVNTEGTRLQFGRPFARITFTARGKAPDGMDLATTESFEAASASGLPKDDVLRAAIARISKDLTGLLTAPTVDPFVGPAIFSGRAAGVFFHEIFGHRIEGHRQKEETEGQTFTKSIGQPVLPEFLSVVFDPTRKKLGSVDLNGWYEFDDEGVPSRPVTLIDKGVLKTFLMSRSPVSGFERSNGHGRRQPGYEVVARQSNLLVESSRSVSDRELRAQLIAEIKRQGKPYGLYFADITGGFTTTGRGGVQAFKVIPLVVYRVYPDGRPDELVRGADVVGTPLASFGKIIATSDSVEVFNGYCGAESGSVPVAAASPALLVSEIEIEKRATSQNRPPLLPPPGGEK